MRRGLLIGILFVSSIILLTACQIAPKKVTELENFCKTPYIEWKYRECCLDFNGNNICDFDEGIQSKGQDENLEQTAQLFAVAWEKKDYEKMYDFLIPELKNIRTKQEFSAIMEVNGISRNMISLRYDGVIRESDNLAYAQYTYNGILKDIKIPTITFRKIQGIWYVDNFANLFQGEIPSTACVDYPDYSKETCADDLAQMLNRKEYCKFSGCRYATCMAKLKGVQLIDYNLSFLSYDEKAEKCIACPSPTTIICLSNLAREANNPKYCEYIDSYSYADKNTCFELTKKVSCADVGCPVGTVAIGNLRGEWYRCDCEQAVRMFINQPANNNKADICFKSIGEAIGKDYKEVKIC